MNHQLYGNLIFELSKEGRKGYSLPKNRFGNYEVPAEICRKEDAQLPECDELTVVRHYTNLSNKRWLPCRSSRTSILSSLPIR